MTNYNKDYIQTKLQFMKKTIYLLTIKHNYNLLSGEDKNEINFLKKKMNLYLFISGGVCFVSYIVFNKLILNNKRFGLSNSFLINRIFDLTFISSLAVTINRIQTGYIVTNYNKRIENLQNRYKFLLKNSIINQDENNEDMKNKIFTEIHKFNYTHVYFLSILVLRILI